MNRAHFVFFSAFPFCFRLLFFSHFFSRFYLALSFPCVAVKAIGRQMGGFKNRFCIAMYSCSFAIFAETEKSPNCQTDYGAEGVRERENRQKPVWPKGGKVLAE
jgi:hypothetical protein